MDLKFRISVFQTLQIQDETRDFSNVFGVVLCMRVLKLGLFFL